MSGEPERLDHPVYVYLIFIAMLITMLAILAGVVYHFALSPHGPAIAAPLKAKYEKKHASAILEEARRLEELEIHRHFHNITPFPQLAENERPVCFICHSDYPHSKSKKVRSLLNMHTQYFVCETCHIKEKEGARIVYKWYNPFDDDPQGPFFGTSYDPETGNLVEVDDLISKIAAFFMNKDKLESTLQIQDAPLALDYMKVRDKLTPEQRDSVKKKFHVNIKPKGHDCKICHSKEGLLDFKKLRFSENRIVDLEQLNIKGMITKYEEFYLPNLFQESKPEDSKAKDAGKPRL
ncbi:MAG: hypothetical protein H8D96_21680 [Desulfobacterales bacterium]|uniref:Cytochrome c-552/4 domain-containing protein n=1 Tax=Candidatus Desulfatibia vada TaxID=2841696 RepID=A0A8J6TRU9_9BACT|nr:hypothetical protein [Candidatus Desulfatibia vada]